MSPVKCQPFCWGLYVVQPVIPITSIACLVATTSVIPTDDASLPTEYRNQALNWNFSGISTAIKNIQQSFGEYLRDNE